MGPMEDRIEFIAPLARAHRVCGGCESDLLQGFYILFALDNEDHIAGLDRLQDARQAIEHAPGLTQIVDPTALSIRSALAEVFPLSAVFVPFIAQGLKK